MYRLRLEGMGESELRRVCASLETIAENLRAELAEALEGKRRAERAVSFWLTSFERVTDSVGDLMREAMAGKPVSAAELKAILDREQCEENVDEERVTKRTAAELEATNDVPQHRLGLGLGLLRLGHASAVPSPVDRGLELEATEIGDPPTYDAALVRHGGSVLLLVKPSRSWDAALHEAIHAMLGPSSLDDESALMAVEYAVCSDLAEPWRSSWRRNFADYGLPWETADGRYRFAIGAANRAPLGQSEEFTRSKEWRRCVALAEQAGFLDLGRVVWGHGVSPAWSDYEG